MYAHREYNIVRVCCTVSNPLIGVYRNRVGIVRQTGRKNPPALQSYGTDRPYPLLGPCTEIISVYPFPIQKMKKKKIVLRISKVSCSRIYASCFRAPIPCKNTYLYTHNSTNGKRFIIILLVFVKI